MKPLARLLFRWLARRTLRRYRPKIVAIAGSIGKTATKEAVAAALRGSMTVRQTSGNFNAEIGVPATIITAGGARRHWWSWVGVALTGLGGLMIRRAYPQVLVLELGSDKPGDLEPLVRLAQPQVGVLTAIAPEHLEFFGDVDAVAMEESMVVTELPPDSTAVANGDDEQIRRFLPGLKCKLIRFGWQEGVEVQAKHMDITMDEHGRPTGQVIKVSVDGNMVPIGLPGVIGRHQAYPILAAVAVGQALKQPLTATIKAMTGYQPPPGRMRLLRGVEGATIIDDSYNASPQAMVAALETLTSVKVPGRTIAILGQMSELGSSAAYWHDWVGHYLAQHRPDQIITVGPLAERIGQAAVTKGFPAALVSSTATAEAAAASVRSHLGPGDLILLKGSRYASRLERAAAMLLEHPGRDRHLLVGHHEA